MIHQLNETDMKVINEVKPGVFEVTVGNKREIAYGNDAAMAAYKRMGAAANVVVSPAYVPDFKRKVGTKIYGV